MKLSESYWKFNGAGKVRDGNGRKHGRGGRGILGRYAKHLCCYLISGRSRSDVTKVRSAVSSGRPTCCHAEDMETWVN